MRGQVFNGNPELLSPGLGGPNMVRSIRELYRCHTYGLIAGKNASQGLLWRLGFADTPDVLGWKGCRYHCILTLHLARCTLHPCPLQASHLTPCAFHLALCTLPLSMLHLAQLRAHLALCTLHLAPCTLHLAPCTCTPPAPRTLHLHLEPAILVICTCVC
jgi:hypothetical protein